MKKTTGNELVQWIKSQLVEKEQVWEWNRQNPDVYTSKYKESKIKFFSLPQSLKNQDQKQQHQHGWLEMIEVRDESRVYGLLELENPEPQQQAIWIRLEWNTPTTLYQYEFVECQLCEMKRLDRLCFQRWVEFEEQGLSTFLEQHKHQYYWLSLETLQSWVRLTPKFTWKERKKILQDISEWVDTQTDVYIEHVYFSKTSHVTHATIIDKVFTLGNVMIPVFGTGKSIHVLGHL